MEAAPANRTPPRGQVNLGLRGMGKQVYLEGQPGGSSHAGTGVEGFWQRWPEAGLRSHAMTPTGPSHWLTLVCQPLSVHCIVSASVRASAGAGAGPTRAGNKTRHPTMIRLALLGAASVPSMHTA